MLTTQQKKREKEKEPDSAIDVSTPLHADSQKRINHYHDLHISSYPAHPGPRSPKKYHETHDQDMSMRGGVGAGVLEGRGLESSGSGESGEGSGSGRSATVVGAGEEKADLEDEGEKESHLENETEKVGEEEEDKKEKTY